jgi:hypothetical protein
LARAKNTDRAGARRRFREQRAAELAARTSTASGDDTLDPETGAPIFAPLPEEEPRRRGFRFPNIGHDLRDLPNIFRERRLLWLPFILVLVSFVVAMSLDFRSSVDTFSQIGVMLIQLVLVPNGLLVFFLAGFLAPRAAYLIGFLLGLFDGILYTVWLALRVGAIAPEGVAVVPLEPSALAANVLYAVVMGTIGAVFAAWYRNFLRSSQERGRRARAEREAKQAAMRKEEARSAKRPARTTTKVS